MEELNIPSGTLETLQKDVADIKVALLGNDYNPKGGLLKRTDCLEVEVDELRKKHEAHEQRVNRIIWTGVGVGTAIGIVWAIISTLIRG